MIAYFVVIMSLIGVGVYKVLSARSETELPLGVFDEKPKRGMRILQKAKELVRKITRDKVFYRY